MKIVIQFIAIYFLFVLLTSVNSLKATHIVGGEMTYRCLGLTTNGANLEIRLTLRRDCFNGSPEAEFDDPAHIGIFDSEGNILRELGLYGVLRIPFSKDDTLNEILKTECEVIGGDVCVHTTTYVGKIFLPFKRGGYQLVYQRCCRNKTITNIIEPELAGATYTIVISDESMRACNSSPRFLDWPPVYICGDRAINFSHAVFDIEGDSVVYSLCAPYIGADTANSKPSTPRKPPYTPVVYKPPFSLFNLLNGNPVLTIDRKTGLLTGQPEPNVVGQYLVGVCVSEFRNGKIFSQTRRDFQYNIRICTTNPVSNFEPDRDVICNEDREVTFTNKSINSKELTWIFDYPRTNYISKDTNPSFVFPSKGIYRVALVAKRAKDCIDTTFQNIYIYDSTLLGADFDFKINSCSDSIKLSFNDKSFDSLASIRNWNWEILLNGNPYKSTKKNPDFIIPDTGNARIRLVITSSRGCQDTIEQDVSLNNLKPNFPITGIPICIGDSTKLLTNPNNRFQYEWSPPASISCVNCPDPSVYPKSDTWYKVRITDGLCELEDSVLVKVSDLLNLDINGDKIICSDSVFLNAVGGIESTIQWSDKQNFSNILSSGSYNLNTTVNKIGTFYVRGRSSANCPGFDSITISNEKVQIEFSGNNYRFCEQDTFSVSINNKDTAHNLNYIWSPSDRIISGQGTKTITALGDSCKSIRFLISAENQYNCKADASAVVEMICKPKVDFSVEKNCDNTFVSFINKSESGNYTWEFGDSTSSTDKSPIHEFKKVGRYTIKLTIASECQNEISKTIDVGFIPVQLNDTILSCNGEPVPLNPSPDLNYKYEWLPADRVSDPNSPNPLSKSDTTIVYKVRVIDPNIENCFIERTVTVFVPPPLNLRINNDTLLCNADTVTLKAQTDIIAKIEWLDGVGLFLGDGYQLKRFFRDSQNIHAFATDKFGCTYQDSFKIIPIIPNFKLIGDTAICPNETGRIIFEQKDKYKYTFSWTPTTFITGSKNSDRIITKPTDTTIYFVEVVNEYGCVYSDSFKVDISRFEPPLEAWADDDTIYFGKSTILHVTPGYEKYKWVNPSKLSCDTCEDPVASPEVSTLYEVHATNKGGCIGVATVRVIVIRPLCNEEDVYLPNIFSPNNDSNNDQWRIRSNFVETLELYVYDRWGERVFETRDPNFQWDGTYKGAELKPDVYAYYFKVQCVDGQFYTEKGNVTIVK
ncbi:MAG: gliding motility-associated C-terminal domain-containing protein [Saprospiraceae bacterium]|nr:gliding motility-associated C-terminal domain-containing protein [Saprospiraceae bacterium]